MHKYWILSILLVLGVSSVSGAELFNETFEDGSYSDGNPLTWDDSGCSTSTNVSKNGYISGSYELDLNGCGGGGAFTGNTGQVLTNPVIEYKFRINSFTSNIDVYFSAWDNQASNTGNSRSVIIRESGGNLNVLGSSTTDTLVSGLQTGKVYTVQLKDFDFSAETYDIYVNGVQEANDKEFWQSASDIESISPAGAGTSSYYDDITVCDSGSCGTSNSAPSVSDSEPSDGSIGVSTGPELNVTVSDLDGDSMNVSFYNAETGNQIGSTQTGIVDGGTASVTWNDLSEYDIYKWYVNVTDGSATTQSSTYSFETEGSISATYLIDNFEDNDTANWTSPGDASISAVSSPVLTGTYSGEVSNSGSASNVESAQVSSNTRNFSFQIRYDPSSSGYINVNPKSGDTTVGNFRCDIGGSGDLEWYDGTSWVLVQSNCQTDTLYNVKIDGDFSANTVDIYLNNTLELQDASFRNTASSWNSVNINLGSGGTAQVDELKFTKTGQISDLSISFELPTTSAGKYPELTSITGNVSASTSNTLERIDLKLYNVSGLQANISTVSSQNYNDFTGLDTGTYYLNATAVSNVTSASTDTREIVLTDYVSRPDPSQVANITVSKQARGVYWNPESTLFAISNKNGQNNDPEGIIYERGSYGSPYKSINLDGDMLLDTAWSPDRNLVAFATAHASSGDLQIYNTSDSSNWVLAKQFSTDGKMHSVDWHPSQAKIIGESLDESVSPDSSDLTVWDVSGSDESVWSEVRQTTQFGTDMFDMDTCGNRLAFSVTDKSNSPTTDKVYVWNISSSNAADWSGLSYSPISNSRKGYFSPDCEFIATQKGDDNSSDRIYDVSDGSLYDTESFIGGGTTLKFSPNVTSDGANLLSGIAGFNNPENIGYYHLSNYSKQSFNHPLSGSSTWSSQNDWSPDGELWTTVQTTADTVFVWDVTDTTPPSSSDNYTAEGFVDKSEETVEISATDSDSGVANITYSVNGGTETTLSGSSATATISTEGNNTLTYYATDNEGNVEAENTEYVALDSTDPSSSDNWTETGYVDYEADIQLTGSDSTSGVANISYRVNGGSYNTITGTSVDLTITSDGNNTLEYYSTDKAGNQEPVQTEYVAIDTETGTGSTDNEKPEAGFSYSPKNPQPGVRVSIASQSLDSDGNITEYQWTVNGTQFSTEQNPGYEFEDSGSYNVSLIVTDDEGATDSVHKMIEVETSTGDLSLYEKAGALMAILGVGLFIAAKL